MGLDYLKWDNIKILKKEAFKGLVDSKIKEVAFSNLNKEKEKRSKVRNLKYKKLKLQNYLASKEINVRRKKLIFKIRTRMIETPENIGKQVPCKLCNIELDTQSHITECIILKLKCPELLQFEQNISEIFNNGKVNDVKYYIGIYEKALRIRQNILKT